MVNGHKGKRNAYPSELNNVGNRWQRCVPMAKITFKVSQSRPSHSRFSHRGQIDFRVELRIMDTG